MKITDVRVRKVAEDGKMKAIVSVTFDDEFVVHDIKIIEGQNGLFIAMPSRKMADGEFRDIAHPIMPPLGKRFKMRSLKSMKNLSDRVIESLLILSLLLYLYHIDKS